MSDLDAGVGTTDEQVSEVITSLYEMYPALQRLSQEQRQEFYNLIGASAILRDAWGNFFNRVAMETNENELGKPVTEAVQ